MDPATCRWYRSPPRARWVICCPARSTGDSFPIAAPEGFGGTLRPYQERGLAWLNFLQSLGLGAVLADDMGLEQTVQMLALIARDPAGTAPTLLVCPMSLVGNWKREAEKFAPATAGPRPPRSRTGPRQTLRRGGRGGRPGHHHLRDCRRDAHRAGRGRLAPTGGRRGPGDQERGHPPGRRGPGVAGDRHRIAVTGTPVENRLADLWSIMEFANPACWAPPVAFKTPLRRTGRAAR